MDNPSIAPYDALLVVSFGGPEAPEDVVPFLENVTRGRGIPTERLEDVAEHYRDFGGRSPINDQCRALIEALRGDLAAHGIVLPIYWGNRNWDPYLTEATRQMQRDGVRRAAAFVTSAFSSYSGCRQYREDLYDATLGLPDVLRIDKLRHYFHHPGFVDASVDATVAALDSLPPERRDGARLVFVTHSIPTAMAESAGPEGGAYEAQHRSVATLVTAAVTRRLKRERQWDLVYCSRSGSPRTPWLEPDVNDHLTQLAAEGCEAAVLVPIGFISDHMEVAFDLDTEATETAEKVGLPVARAATAGVHPAFVAMVRELLVERATSERGEVPKQPALGELGVSWDVCEAHCCPNLRGPRPALCERPPHVEHSS